MIAEDSNLQFERVFRIGSSAGRPNGIRRVEHVQQIRQNPTSVYLPVVWLPVI